MRLSNPARVLVGTNNPYKLLAHAAGDLPITWSLQTDGDQGMIVTAEALVDFVEMIRALAVTVYELVESLTSVHLEERIETTVSLALDIQQRMIYALEAELPLDSGHRDFVFLALTAMQTRMNALRASIEDPRKRVDFHPRYFIFTDQHPLIR